MEVEQLNTRILSETPPSGILYYKYKAKEPEDDEDDDDEDQKEISSSTGMMMAQDTEVKKRRKHPILETHDKSKIKIRFSDLPLSRCT